MGFCLSVHCLTSHTEWASRTQWARRRGWRWAACVPGICSSVLWERSERWSWCCWANRCSCRRRWGALCCAAGWFCAPGTAGGTSAWTAAAPGPWALRLCCWKCRVAPGKRSWLVGPPPCTSRQGVWHRLSAPGWSPAPSDWSWRYASPPDCGQWWTTEKITEGEKEEEKVLKSVIFTTLWEVKLLQSASSK